METLTAAADICSILSLFVSGFAAYKIMKVQQSVSQSGGNNKAMNQTAKGNNNTQTGRQ